MATHTRLQQEDDDEDLVSATRHDAIDLPMPKWERRMVVASLAVHMADIVLDVLVFLLLYSGGFSDFAMGSGFVVLWAWLASSLYISCTTTAGDDDMDEGMVTPRHGRRFRQAVAFLCNLTQVQIFLEAYRCLFRRGDGDYFHTLRLMEAILEAAPNSLVHLYVLAYWPERSPEQPYATHLLRMSIFVAFLSVSISFAMFEQKVQQRTSGGYVICSALMRFFEIGSRTSTLALFATLYFPNGLWCLLLVDYVIMVVLTVRHKSVRINYSFFLSLPLVLISYEPVVWRREDLVVPKDWYYLVRIVEFVVMWCCIVQQQANGTLIKVVSSPSWYGICSISWLFSVGMCVMFPLVSRIARRHELSRDGADEGAFDPLQQNEEFYSDSDHDSDYQSDHEEHDEPTSETLLPSASAQNEADEGLIEME